MAGLPSLKEDNHAFMTCVLRVNVQSTEWQKIVRATLNNIQGVSNFRMDNEGRIEVSGTVDPVLLLKTLAKAGKKAELCWLQFGQCSSNLYIPHEQTQYNYNGQYSIRNSNYYGDTYGEYDHYYSNHRGGYGEGNSYYGDNSHLHYDHHYHYPHGGGWEGGDVGYHLTPPPPPLPSPFVAREYDKRPISVGGRGLQTSLSKRDESVNCCSLM